MFRETIYANIHTDVERETAVLHDHCLAAGLDQPTANLLVSQAADTLKALVNQGQRIASVGGQMEATRELSGDGYLVRLVFSEGVRKKFFQRLLEKLKGS